MTSLIHTAPFILSILIGYSILSLLFKKDKTLSGSLKFFLSVGLGLGLSAEAVFYQLLFLDSPNRIVTIGIHIIALAVLTYTMIKTDCFPSNQLRTFKLNPEQIKILFKKSWPIAILILAFLPYWRYANLYPYGGWDAWAVWNIK